jgi:ABC-type transport system involved in multi-copper enzyme maturation permease subunit
MANMKVFPSTTFLIIVHAILLFGVITYGCQNPFSLFFRIAVYIPFLIISLLIQWLIVFVYKRWIKRNVFRVAGIMSPIFMYILIGFLLPSQQKPNQTSPLPSPSGEFVMKMKIQDNLWKVHLYNQENELIYKDDDSSFFGQFNCYWYWDENDNLWLYNSDDGSVYFWRHQNGKWVKKEWGYSVQRQIDEEISPPKELYPHYENAS